MIGFEKAKDADIIFVFYLCVCQLFILPFPRFYLIHSIEIIYNEIKPQELQMLRL